MIFKAGIIEALAGREIITDSYRLEKVIDVLSESFNLILLLEEPVLFDDREQLLNKQQIKDEYNKKILIYSNIAQKYSLNIAVGTLLELVAKELYKTAVLFNPNGEIILKQHQIYIEQDKEFMNKKTDKKNSYNLDDFDKENHLVIKAGNKINYANTELGKVGILLNHDCWHPQIGRIMALDGIDIVLAVNMMKDPYSNKSVYNPWQQLAGVWSQVQQNQFIAMEGSIGGQNLIHAPCEITPCRTGILAPKAIDKEPAENNVIDYFDLLSRNYKEIDGFRIISSEINIDSLREIRNSYPLMNYLNKPLYCKEMEVGSNVGKFKE